MKKIILLSVLATSFLSSNAQDSLKTESSDKQWNFSADANFYFFTDDFIFLPVFKADKNALHLEARYNYEDLETFSGWIGYNFSGGKKFEYTITPMIGGVVGSTDGLASGLECTFSLGNFELYTESEYLFDAETSENNFYYMWTDFLYYPKDWLWLGLSGQRTRLYQTELDIQRGLLLGGGYKNFELTSYFYNLDLDNPFILITLAASF